MIKKFSEFINERVEIEYTANDFDTNDIITKDVLQYVIDNVDEFEARMYLALGTIEKMRCSLDYADGDLFNDIVEKVGEYYEDNSENEEVISLKSSLGVDDEGFKELIPDMVEEIFG